MRIHPESYSTILVTWLICIPAIFLLLKCVPWRSVSWPLSAFLAVMCIFVVWFHRIPVRTVNDDDRKVTAVCDGKVVIREKVFEKEYFQKECIQVSVFMSFFDVHVNFWPMNGKISYYKYHPGKYLLAFLPKSSEKNEHSSTVVENEHGAVLFKQIAGTFARRIVCYSEVGKDVKSGRECGLIKFGSRIDYFLPLDADIKVNLGDRTIACETVIAELK